MVTLLVCLIIACFLPYLARLAVALPMSRQPEGYNNRHPRAQQAALKGFGARAVAAHLNSFESLAIFGPAVVTAIATGHTGREVGLFAICHVIFRGLYTIFYWINWSTLRSLVWFLGYISAMVILFKCLP